MDHFSCRGVFEKRDDVADLLVTSAECDGAGANSNQWINYTALPRTQHLLTSDWACCCCPLRVFDSRDPSRERFAF